MALANPLIRSTLIMLAAGIVILMAIVGSTVWLGHINNVYSGQTAQLRLIRSALVDVLATIQDAETGQRGYMLTNDIAYLYPYTAAVERLPERLTRLKDRTTRHPDYADQVMELKAVIRAKMAELARTMELKQAGDAAGAMAIVRSGAGRDDMIRIRDALNTLLTRTDDKLRVLVVDQLSAASTLQWVTIGGAFAIVLMAGGAVMIILRHIREVSAMRDEVALLNIGLEARVNERTRDLIQANQEIQRFAYIVTHDLRAPLVNIMGFLSELETSVKAVSAYVLTENGKLTPDTIQKARFAVTEDLPEAVGFIRSSTRKMDSLINAILKISRDGRRKLQPESLDLEGIVKVTSASLQHQIAASEGRISISAQVKEIVSDRFSIEQIIGNLFDNALKYRHPSRPLELKVNIRPEGRNYVIIDVEDNGRGIAKQDHERIFELFRRAGDQDQKGEGIGLAYVRSLIRNLGGDITVESELGAGSTFRLMLPLDLTKIVRSMDQ